MEPKEVLQFCELQQDSRYKDYKTLSGSVTMVRVFFTLKLMDSEIPLSFGKSFDTVFCVFVGSQVGFTVRVPRDSTDPRIFDTVVYNSAAGFDMASGKFVCQRPGTYLFTSTIIRNDVGGDALCDITVNGTRLLRVIAPTGYFSGTGSLVIHLSICPYAHR